MYYSESAKTHRVAWRYRHGGPVSYGEPKTYNGARTWAAEMNASHRHIDHWVEEVPPPADPPGRGLDEAEAES